MREKAHGLIDRLAIRKSRSGLAARRLERDGVDVTLAVGGDLSRIDLDDRELHVLAFRGETRDAPAGSRFIAVADFADARAVPVPSGPFGGTTLLVVPRGVPTEDREAWVAIAASGAMHEAHSRFHRLVVALKTAIRG